MEGFPSKRKKFDDNVDDSRNVTDTVEQTNTAGNQDKEYFQSYADVGIHEEMLNDAVRTNAYRYAILKNYEKIRGKVVADVGAGTGILSIFCVQAGAKKVYAIEGSSLSTQTRLVVAENKMSDRITVIQGKAEDVRLPEKVDVIVSEWMGYSLLYESMLPSVLHIRDHWMKKGGLMLPSSAVLYIAPFSDDEITEKLEIWSEMKDRYKVSMDCMKNYARQCISRGAHVRCVSPEDIISHGYPLVTFDLHKVSISDISDIQRKFELSCFGSSIFHGFVLWFTVTFPENVVLSTSPYSQETHWGQTLFYNDTEIEVKQDTRICGNLSIKPNRNKPRFLDVHISYQVDKDDIKQKYYYMSDNIT
ncbi:protein arginine N-methyltransferase 6-like isoform X2 [Saccostrea echinata]|uniref:protein arginine N-methyltransferase 6-like isoform X2 n=1 Tax=Saccostrea echinata TaxID=191078 RepID=UPI002A836468|nr:protein arginine N-methyltransferase 6-like isoform X2 [Saccostrea echinata]